MVPVVSGPAWGRAARDVWSYAPFMARTCRWSAQVAPAACDWVRLEVVRDGSAILLGESVSMPVTLGDVVAIGPKVMCGGVPEGRITVTTIRLDTDYVIDQTFWQYSDMLADRHAARALVGAAYAEPVQIIRLGETRLRSLAPTLDELVRRSEAGHSPGGFFRMQALLFAVIDTLAPHIKTPPAPACRVSRPHAVPALPRWRRFVAIRPEVREVEAAMRADIARPWPLTALGGIAHLSGSQVSRVFVQTYGKTPLAYLSMLRVEEMTRLLRETDLTTLAVGRRVGWSSREHAARVFRRYVGVTPAQYRRTGPPTAVPHTVGSGAHLHGEDSLLFTAKEPQP